MMSEQPSQLNKNETMAAKNLERIQVSEGLLSASGKDLASLHPVVTDFVETDVKNVDFGRIKDVDDAREMAYRQPEIIKEGQKLNLDEAFDYTIGKPGVPMPRASINELNAEHTHASSNEQLDREISRIILDKVLTEEAEKYNSLPGVELHTDAELESAVKAAYKIAGKAVTDFQLTQGSEDAFESRFAGIYTDISKQNPDITGAEIGTMIDAAQRVVREAGAKDKFER